VKNFFAVIFFLFLAGCASKPIIKEEPPSKLPPLKDKTRIVQPPIVVDYIGLQKTLKINRSTETVGYLEKPFQTCKVGNGYPQTAPCDQHYFVLIHFRLLCRNAEESSHTAFDSSSMAALSGRAIRWSLGKQEGSFNLDEEGYGQIRTTVRASHKGQRLRIAADNEVLYIRAGDIGRIVAPPSWCAN
jgi:hypothetical protein